jgi:hypothetical protein
VRRMNRRPKFQRVRLDGTISALVIGDTETSAGPPLAKARSTCALMLMNAAQPRRRLATRLILARKGLIVGRRLRRPTPQ